MQNFIARYPGTSSTFVAPVRGGFPAWLRWQHFFSIMFMLFILRSGLQILADHPRLYLNSGCCPGSEWMRMRAEVPFDRMDKSVPPRVWTSKDGRYYDCHRIEHMREPMALLAYEMNGQPLSETHGAPLRLRNELELGFKQVKWITAIEFVADFHAVGWGQGGYNEDHEYYGYRMPI